MMLDSSSKEPMRTNLASSGQCFNNGENCSCHRVLPAELRLLFTEQLNREMVKQLRAGWISEQQPQQEEADKGHRGEGDFGSHVWGGGGH